MFGAPSLGISRIPTPRAGWTDKIRDTICRQRVVVPFEDSPIDRLDHRTVLRLAYSAKPEIVFPRGAHVHTLCTLNAVFRDSGWQAERRPRPFVHARNLLLDGSEVVEDAVPA